MELFSIRIQRTFQLVSTGGKEQGQTPNYPGGKFGYSGSQSD